MIKSIQLRNFESHKNTILEFSPHINIISGQSDNGKSSIIRGLYWIKDNKPASNPMISFWNRDSKGLPIKPTYTEITLKEGGRIRRERSSKLGGYLLGDKPLEAVGQSVPPEVTETLNLSEVNIQYQFDRPFLLDDGPAEVARLFNRTIKLDLIDSVQAEAERSRRSITQEISSGEDKIKELTIAVDSYRWIEKAEKILVKVEELEESIEVDDKKLSRLKELIGSYIDYKKQAIAFKKIAECKSISDETDKVNSNIEELEYKKNRIDELIASAKKLESSLEVLEKIKDKTELVDKIDSLIAIIKEKEKDKERIDSLIKEVKWNQILMDDETVNLFELKKQLPDTCPLCGAKLE